MILEIALLLFINSLYIIGLSAASMIEWKSNSPNKLTAKNISKQIVDVEYSQILWQLRFMCYKFFGFKWSKPLISCPTCMASVHGTLFYVFIFYSYIDFHYHLEYEMYFKMYLIYILSLAGLNTILSKYI